MTYKNIGFFDIIRISVYIFGHNFKITDIINVLVNCVFCYSYLIWNIVIKWDWCISGDANKCLRYAKENAENNKDLEKAIE